jgi:hypothetical protein
MPLLSELRASRSFGYAFVSPGVPMPMDASTRAFDLVAPPRPSQSAAGSPMKVARRLLMEASTPSATATVRNDRSPMRPKTAGPSTDSIDTVPRVLQGSHDDSCVKPYVLRKPASAGATPVKLPSTVNAILNAIVDLATREEQLRDHIVREETTLFASKLTKRFLHERDAILADAAAKQGDTYDPSNLARCPTDLSLDSTMVMDDREVEVGVTYTDSQELSIDDVATVTLAGGRVIRKDWYEKRIDLSLRGFQTGRSIEVDERISRARLVDSINMEKKVIDCIAAEATERRAIRDAESARREAMTTRKMESREHASRRTTTDAEDHEFDRLIVRTLQIATRRDDVMQLYLALCEDLVYEHRLGLLDLGSVMAGPRLSLLPVTERYERVSIRVDFTDESEALGREAFLLSEECHRRRLAAAHHQRLFEGLAAEEMESRHAIETEQVCDAAVLRRGHRTVKLTGPAMEMAEQSGIAVANRRFAAWRRVAAYRRRMRTLVFTRVTNMAKANARLLARRYFCALRQHSHNCSRVARLATRSDAEIRRSRFLLWASVKRARTHSAELFSLAESETHARNVTVVQVEAACRDELRSAKGFETARIDMTSMESGDRKSILAGQTEAFASLVGDVVARRLASETAAEDIERCCIEMGENCDSVPLRRAARLVSLLPVAERLAATNAMIVINGAFAAWAGFRGRRRRHRKLLNQRASSLGATNARVVFRCYFRKLRSFASSHARIHGLVVRSSAELRRLRFSPWLRLLAVRAEVRRVARAKLEDAEQYARLHDYDEPLRRSSVHLLEQFQTEAITIAEGETRRDLQGRLALQMSAFVEEAEATARDAILRDEAAPLWQWERRALVLRRRAYRSMRGDDLESRLAFIRARAALRHRFHIWKHFYVRRSRVYRNRCTHVPRLESQSRASHLNIAWKRWRYVMLVIHNAKQQAATAVPSCENRTVEVAPKPSMPPVHVLDEASVPRDPLEAELAREPNSPDPEPAAGLRSAPSEPQDVPEVATTEPATTALAEATPNATTPGEEGAVKEPAPATDSAGTDAQAALA